MSNIDRQLSFSGMSSPQRMPRSYAMEIIQIEDRQGRIDALQRVPDDMRTWVYYYVTTWWPKRHLILKRERTRQP